MTNQAVSAAILLLALAPGPALGEQAGDAPRVRLRATAQLTIDDTASDLDGTRWYEGRLVAWNAGSLTLAMNTAGDPARLRVPRWGITEFQAYRGKARGVPALIGLGIGAGVGLIWGATARAGCRSEGSGHIIGLCDLDMIAPLLVTLPVGTTVGAVVGRERWETVPVESLAPPLR